MDAAKVNKLFDERIALLREKSRQHAALVRERILLRSYLLADDKKEQPAGSF